MAIRVSDSLSRLPACSPTRQASRFGDASRSGRFFVISSDFDAAPRGTSTGRLASTASDRTDAVDAISERRAPAMTVLTYKGPPSARKEAQKELASLYTNDAGRRRRGGVAAAVDGEPSRLASDYAHDPAAPAGHDTAAAAA